VLFRSRVNRQLARLSMYYLLPLIHLVQRRLRFRLLLFSFCFFVYGFLGFGICAACLFSLSFIDCKV